MAASVAVYLPLSSSAEGEAALRAEPFNLWQLRRRRHDWKTWLRHGRVPRVRFAHILIGRASQKQAAFGQRQQQHSLGSFQPRLSQQRRTQSDDRLAVRLADELAEVATRE